MPVFLSHALLLGIAMGAVSLLSAVTRCTGGALVHTVQSVTYRALDMSVLCPRTK